MFFEIDLPPATEFTHYPKQKTIAVDSILSFYQGVWPACDNYEVVVIEHRGHGSDGVTISYAMEAYDVFKSRLYRLMNPPLQ